MVSLLVFNSCTHLSSFFFFFNDTATTEIYTLSLHDALPIYEHDHADDGEHGQGRAEHHQRQHHADQRQRQRGRSEEHTSELQSPCNLVCRLLLEKKKTNHSSLSIRPPATIWCDPQITHMLMH